MHSSELVPHNRLKARLREGQLSLCMAVRLFAQPDIVLMARAAGFDALYVDFEHGAISLDAFRGVAVAALAAGLTCLARVPDIAEAARVLDAGASGIIVPNVKTVAQARAAVEAVRFEPEGRRGVAISFPQYGYVPVPAATALPALNESTLVALQIESLEGLANVDAIAAVDGVDMLLLGSNDLLADMGLAGLYDHERLHDAFRAIAAACGRHSVALGIGGLSGRPDIVKRLVGLGGSFISTGSDVGFLTAALCAKVADYRRPL